VNISIIVLMSFLSFNTLASVLIEKNILDNIGAIHSLKFDNDQSVTVYLPDKYIGSSYRYPVMYVVDGERFFLHSIAYQKTLISESKTPPFIVVGINTKNIDRRELLDKKSVELIDTFQGQIIPYIDKTYRTNDMRMYFGWEMAGGFALELLAKQPTLFDAYFLASSTNFTQERLDNVDNLLKSKTPIGAFIYYTLGSVESWSLGSHKSLSDIFTHSTRKELNWKFQLSASDDHYTTPFDTFNKGLALYFHDYAPIRFYSLKEFDVFGGIPALKSHYKKRGEHYQVSTDIHGETKHYLLNQAINENNFPLFKQLVMEFNGFIESFNYSSGFIIKVGRFYSKNNDINAAISLYRSEILKHPDSVELQKELAKLNSI
jgi:predicted alpha/beta superfamily hydrolase